MGDVSATQSDVGRWRPAHRTAKVLSIARKDLRSTMRNRPALMMMLAAPLLLAGLLGFAFGGGSSFQIAATKVAVANGDVAVASQAGGQTSGSSGGQTGGSVGQTGGLPRRSVGDSLVGVLTSSGLKDVLAITREPDGAAARKRVDDGKAANAVIVPRGFSAALYGNQGQSSAVELYENPTQTLGNSITASVVSRTLLDFNGARAAAAAAAVAGGAGGHEQAAQAAAAKFINGGGVEAALNLSDRAPLTSAKKSKQTSTAGQILAGMMIFFMFFGASNVARTIMTEDRAGTLPRLLTTPTSAGTILGGKFSSVYLTVTAQAVLLLIAGRLIFGIHWGGITVVVLLTVSAACVASGLALLVISAVRSPAQAGAIGAGVYLVLALLGGNFTGTATVGTTYATIQRLTPNGWLINGWDTAMRGGGVGDVLKAVLIPLAFAAAFFSVAVVRFRRRYV
jgi:ABC-2 type transport system permease protein